MKCPFCRVLLRGLSTEIQDVDIENNVMLTFKNIPCCKFCKAVAVHMKDTTILMTAVERLIQGNEKIALDYMKNQNIISGPSDENPMT